MRRVAVGLVVITALLGGYAFRRVERSSREPENSRFSSDACRDAYVRAFAGPSFEIRVVFGYKDARPARFVADRYERMLLVDRLVAPCGIGGGLCGFQRDAKDMDLFTKSAPGPDAAPREFRIRVVAPSVGADDVENRKDPLQARRSDRVERVFLDGLNDADVVIYNGHSRAGGGPDFRPPRLRGRSVDYGWYREKTPGISPVLRGLREAKGERKLKLLGFLSCASTKHFVGKVDEARPGLATLTSPKLLYFSDALEASVELLTSILTLSCDPDFSSALANAETRVGGIRMNGWLEAPVKSD